MKETEVAYLAGLLDGEGSISVLLRKTDKAFNTEVVVSNTNLKIIELFNPLLPSHNREQQFRNCKKLTRIAYRKHADILFVLERLLPYMALKKRQAELMIAFCKSRLSIKKRQYTEDERRWVAEIRLLNKR